MKPNSTTPQLLQQLIRLKSFLFHLIKDNEEMKSQMCLGRSTTSCRLDGLNALCDAGPSRKRCLQRLVLPTVLPQQ